MVKLVTHTHETLHFRFLLPTPPYKGTEQTRRRANQNKTLCTALINQPGLFRWFMTDKACRCYDVDMLLRCLSHQTVKPAIMIWLRRCFLSVFSASCLAWLARSINAVTYGQDMDMPQRPWCMYSKRKPVNEMDYCRPSRSIITPEIHFTLMTIKIPTGLWLPRRIAHPKSS